MKSLTGVGLFYSLIPVLIFSRQEGCGRNGVFARNLNILNRFNVAIVVLYHNLSQPPRLLFW
jgi:hypothetical protein